MLPCGGLVIRLVSNNVHIRSEDNLNCLYHISFPINKLTVWCLVIPPPQTVANYCPLLRCMLARSITLSLTKLSRKWTNCKIRLDLSASESHVIWNRKMWTVYCHCFSGHTNKFELITRSCKYLRQRPLPLMKLLH